MAALGMLKMSLAMTQPLENNSTVDTLSVKLGMCAQEGESYIKAVLWPMIDLVIAEGH